MKGTRSLAGALLLARMAAPAQPAPPEEERTEFSADRPGFSLPTNVLERGLAQIETGFTFVSQREGDTLVHTFLDGSPLLRFGVGARAELRLGGDGFLLTETRAKEGRQHVNGWSDFAVGAKVSVLEERHRIPAVSLLASLSFPSGEDAFTSAAHDPGVGLVWSKKLADWTAGGVFTFASVTNDFKRSLQRSTAVSIGFPTVASLAFYSEVYHVRTGGEADSSVWMAGGGVSRVLGGSFQLDLETGRRLSVHSPGWFVAGGFVFRYRTAWAK